MRRIVLTISCVALLAALWGLWQNRYEHTQGFPVWRIIDIQKNAPSVAGVEWLGSENHPILRMMVDSQNPRIAAGFQIPGAPAVEMLHLKFRLNAYGLKRGNEKWEEGRLIVDWYDPARGGKLAPTPVAAIVGDDRDGLNELVIKTHGNAAVPTLRLENLGRS